MNCIVKWFLKYELKRNVTNASVKSAIHDLNAKFANRVRVEGRETLVHVANDALSCVSIRLDGFSDDGKISDDELSAINSADDAMIDRYFSDEQIGALIERLLVKTENKKGVNMNNQEKGKKDVLASKIKKTVGKLVKPAKKLAVFAAIASVAVGCATVDEQSPQPNEQKSLQAGKSETQNVEMHNSNVYIFVGVKKVPMPGSTNNLDKIVFGECLSDAGHTISVLSQAQALETSGSTESYSPSNAPSNAPSSSQTATPTNDVKPDIKLTYGLVSDTASGRSWISDLTDASVRGISSLIQSGKSSKTTVTHNDGRTEVVTCANGACTNSCGDRITCSGGACMDSCSEGSCGSCSK